MSPEHDPQPAHRQLACPRCLARSELLTLLSARIEHAAIDEARLLEILSLSEEEMIVAIGGRRRQELLSRHRALLAEPRRSLEASAICCHDRLHQDLFGDRLAPSGALSVLGRYERLADAAGAPVVALVGDSQASDYGMEMAAALARGLAASGVSLAANFTPGIAAAAHLGVLEAAGAPLAAMPGGVEVCVPARLRGLHRSVIEHGAAISELPAGFRPRRWSRRLAERMLAAIAQLVILVEGERCGEGMLTVQLAQAHGASVGAVPGRITSPGARGPHALLRARTAGLVACPEDALDLLYGIGNANADDPLRGLPPRQRATLERIGAGQDTLEELCCGTERQRTLVAVSELRMRRLLARGDGGRYIPRVSLDDASRPRDASDEKRASAAD